MIMSQVMAVEHSMLELGCDQSLVRNFVYHMCVVQQLSESMRHQLLQHLLEMQEGHEGDDDASAETVEDNDD